MGTLRQWTCLAWRWVASLRLSATLLGGSIVMALWQGADAQVLLPGHSIASPPDIINLANDWFLAGTVIPSTQSLLLSPGIPRRMGLLWSRFPLLTNDFEVTCKLRITKSEEMLAKEAGIAFWYVYENVSSLQEELAEKHLHNQEEIISGVWDLGFQPAGFDLLGYRSQYDGLGVFFIDSTKAEKQPPVVQPLMMALANDGTKPYKMWPTTPFNDFVEHDFRSTSEITLKIRVQPSGASVDFGGIVQQEMKREFKAGGYLGITIYGGTKGSISNHEKVDKVELLQLQVTNHDPATQGESVPRPPVDPPIPQPAAGQAGSASSQKEDILAATSSFKEHREESGAIKDLTNMVFKLVMESQPARKQMLTAIATLENRIKAMELTFGQLQVMLDKKLGHSLGKEFEAIKRELATFGRDAHHEAQVRHKKLAGLHEDLSGVHKSVTSDDSFERNLNQLSESNKRTIESLVSEHQRIFGVSIAAIAFIIISGLSLYNKFRCWEKKHVL